VGDHIDDGIADADDIEAGLCHVVAIGGTRWNRQRNI
jgi:hypothetical protein